MYATTRYNFLRLKVTHKISPLEELVGGRSPPSSSQRLTGMCTWFINFYFIRYEWIISLYQMYFNKKNNDIFIHDTWQNNHRSTRLSKNTRLLELCIWHTRKQVNIHNAISSPSTKDVSHIQCTSLSVLSSTKDVSHIRPYQYSVARVVRYSSVV